MTTLNPYINFSNLDGHKTREAMTFYKDCIDGSLELSTIGGSPIAEHMPPDMHDSILHAVLSKNGVVLLMGSDMIQGDLAVGNNVSLMLQCESEEDIRRFFDRLSEGGKVRDELGLKFWGGMFGAFTDKYGINWALHFDQNHQDQINK